MKHYYFTKKNTEKSLLSNRIIRFLLVSFVVLFWTTVQGQGTNCGTSIAVTVNGACITSGTIQDTNQSGPNIGTCTGGFNREGWYSFTVTGGPKTITITASASNRNLYLQLVSESTPCGGFAQVACANADTNNNSAQTETITQVLNNGTYYIKVVNVGSQNNNMTLTNLCVTSPICTTPTAQPTSLLLSALTSTSINGAFTAASPAPSGYLVLRSTSATAPSPGPVNGTTYTVGNTISGATVVAASNTTSFSATGLTSNTQYYFYVYSYNDSCAGAPYYQTTSPLSTYATTCPAAPTAAVNSGITGTGATISWTASIAGGAAATINYTLEVYTDAGYTTPISGSPFAMGTAVTYTLSGLNSGTTYYYRIKANNGSCDSTYLTNTLQTNCNTPSAQPTALVFSTLTSTSIAGSFTAASPAPSGYLIIRSTSATPPTPVNGTTYAVGSNLGAGTYVVQGSAVTSAAVSFTDTGLTSNTQYYYYIYSYNNSCNGAPYYLSTAPLSNNAITCPAAPTAAVNSAITGSAFTVSWTASLAGGSAGTINYTLEVYTNAGFTLPISGSPFSMGTAVTATLTGLNAATTYYYRIKANNGSCDSAYLTGSVITGCTTPSAQPTTLVLSTITSTSINGAFTAASPAPSGYLIVRSTSAIAPTLANGTTYAVGFTGLTPGFTRVIQGSAVTSTAVTFTDTGLTSNTKYYYHIFSYNNGCGGAPYYLTTTPLTNNAITCPAAPTAAVNSAINTSGFTVSWTASPVGGGAATINYTLEVYTNATYTTPISGSPFSVGTALTYTLSGLAGPTTYYYRIKANNGSCDSSYLTNSATTLLSNDNCTGAIAITPSTSCTYTTYTNAGATASAGVPAPGCANYIGGDVWFSVLVPSTGAITINSIEGVITDGGMAVYTGTCAGLTLLQCDDDSSINGLMPYMALTGLTPNSTLWIRFWEYGNDNNGTFGLCVTAPIPCAAGPGTGTTTVPCPSVTSGGLGLNGAPPQALTCGASAACVDLEATYPLYYNTTTYTVSSIPYAPPYQYTCLANAVSVNVDDVWSPLVTLPFNFCFYGNNYNQCLIGSNGTITFDTSSNLAGGTSTWSFANNIPNNTLFLNTIFGVYHDIDPSKGGKVGWELITLNTGCRALVASWSDIPMFSAACNAQLYSGMIVLYENTNVIEVYIKDKSVCASWNSGNAIVGLQNATGTQAVVAPGRNALDADWAVTNEAWRFTPAGASITSIKWYQGAGTTGPVVGTTGAINVCPSATTTYTAEVSYALCNGTTLKTSAQTTVTISSGKTWTGSVDTDWNKPTNWSPSGVPTSADCVVIPNVTNDPIISGSGYNAFANNLTLQTGANLQLNSGNNLTVTDFISVTSAIFTVKNGANLVQINNSAVNTGNIIMERTTNVHNYDYVYWSSPVAGFSSAAISPGTSSYLIYKWDTTLSNGNGGQGTWVGGSETMTAGKGYIVRGPDAYSALAPFTASFTGVPNNGIIQPTIARGSITGPNFTGTNGANITNLDDNWNLLGNPYPCAINATTFLANNPNIDGNIRIWTHGSPISETNPNPFYGSFLQNYTVNDYVSYNATGSTPPGYNGKIGAGQGFFVVMNDGAATTSTVTFNNSLRSSAYNNTQFYKSNNEASTADEAHRIWLSLVDGSSSSATTLLGYVSEATYDKDRLFDAPYKVVPQLSIYSLLDSNPMIIQGRPVPFDDNDFIPLGVTTPVSGVYTLAIYQVDGLFENTSQTIYLEDTYNNVVYDLRQAPYSFSANAGNYTDRFILRYKNTILSNPAFDNSATYGYISNHILHIKSTEQIKEIALFDIAGKHIITYKTDINKTNIEEHFPYANGVYIANIKLEDGKIVTRKLLN